MATVSHLVTLADTANVTTYTTASFTPTTGDLLVVLAYVKATTATATCSGSANGLTFTSARQVLGDSNTARAAVFVSDAVPASPASMTVSVDVTGDAGTGAVVVVLRVAGMSKYGSAAVAQTSTDGDSNLLAGQTPDFTFTNATATGNPIVCMVGNNTNPATLTPPTGFTEAVDTGFATPTSGMEVAYVDSGQTASTYTYGNTSTRGAVIGVEIDASGSATQINPNDGAHAHAAESPAITQTHALTASDAAHAHSGESPALSVVVDLAPNDATHGHAAESPAVDLSTALTPNDATHAHVADAPGLAQTHALTANDGSHAHSAESPAPSQVHALVGSEASHAHAAETPTLTVTYTLAPNDGSHAHAAESPALTGEGVLSPNDGNHAHSSETPAITQTHVVAPSGAQHALLGEPATLTQLHALAATSSTLGHGVESPALAIVVAITPNDATHAHTVDSPNLAASAVSRGRAQRGTTTTPSASIGTHDGATARRISRTTPDAETTERSTPTAAGG